MKAVFCLFLVLLAGCAHFPQRSALGWIQVSSDGQSFTEAPSPNSTPRANFHPWGFNYDRDYNMRLIEDYWETEWETVVEDFHEMKNLGANVVRVHLQFSKFMKDAHTPNEAALKKLDDLLQLAEHTGLHLDLTGLACYRKTDVPEWYDALNESARWESQATFWVAIARTCRKSPAVFCYNLMNEPFVPNSARKPGDWLVGELAGFWYVQAITLDPAGRDHALIARQWVDRLVAAIRKQDAHHMITVGLLPNSLATPVSGSGFIPSEIAHNLDFISVHVYPASKKLEADLQNLRGYRIGKPLVVEEIFPLGCGMAELVEFIDRSRPHVNGWISFYWGQTPEELAAENSIPAAMLLEWLEFFQTRGPEMRGPISAPTHFAE